MQLTFEQVKSYIENRSVIILGSAPSVQENSVEFLESFDLIVRLNNYKFFNDCNKIDIYYSFFGRSIKKTKEDVLNDNVKIIMCKYPNTDWGCTVQGFRDDWSKVYKNNDVYNCINYYIAEDDNFRDNFRLLNRIPTTGISAILDIRRFAPKSIYITGFDFFESGIHNITEKWKQGDGHHNLEAEKKLIKTLYTLNLINIDNNIKLQLEKI